MEGEQPTNVEACGQGHVAAVEIAWHEAYLSTEFYCEACGANWLEADYD